MRMASCLALQLLRPFLRCRVFHSVEISSVQYSLNLRRLLLYFAFHHSHHCLQVSVTTHILIPVILTWLWWSLRNWNFVICCCTVTYWLLENGTIKGKTLGIDSLVFVCVYSRSRCSLIGIIWNNWSKLSSMATPASKRKNFEESSPRRKVVRKLSKPLLNKLIF